MADLTPTTDTKGPPKKTAIILLGAGGAILLYFVWKKKKEKIEYNQQSFVPVTAENVGGVGAPGGGGTGSPGAGNEGINNALINAEIEQTKTITGFLTEEAKNRATEREALYGPEGLISKLLAGNAAKTGGGAPGEGQPGGKGGNGSGGGGEGSTGTHPPSPPHIASCPTGWKWNPAYGAPSIHSCYHISKETCNKGRTHLHGYQDGKEICPV